MKRMKIAGAALLTAALLGNAALAAESGQTFDFERDDGGFTPVFADYPAGGMDDFYELRHQWAQLPDKDGRGLFLSGNNHSDDLFMGYSKEISGLTAGQLYEFHVTFRLATNVDGGMIGVGGSPGSSVFVKGGVTALRPHSGIDAHNQYRLNIDKGNQGTGGCDMLLLGNLEKEESRRPGEYEWKSFEFTMQAKADETGCAYLILGTDSGFEAVSSYYLDDIALDWSECRETAITRGAAVRMMYDTVQPGPSGEPSFPDIGADSPDRGAIGWAQESGLVNGYGTGRFGAEDALTVPQALAILYRYAGSPAVGENGADQGRVPAWAKDAAAWALQSGLISENDLTNDASVSEYVFTRAWRAIN